METRLARLSMPPNERLLQETVLLVLRLPNLLRLEVTPKGLEITRAVDAGEDVLSQTVEDTARGLEPETADIEFLLKNLRLHALPFVPDRPELHTLIDMYKTLSMHALQPVAWYVPRGNSLPYFLALRMNEQPAELLGVPVHYVSDDQMPEGKLLLVGSKTRYAIDAEFGVITDIAMG